METRYNEHANTEFNRCNEYNFGPPHVEIMLYAMRRVAIMTRQISNLTVTRHEMVLTAIKRHKVS